jgi:hypothetical protein
LIGSAVAAALGRRAVPVIGSRSDQVMVAGRFNARSKIRIEIFVAERRLMMTFIETAAIEDFLRETGRLAPFRYKVGGIDRVAWGDRFLV